MITKVDEKWYSTTNLSFKDQGPVAPGRVTRVFNVTARKDSSFLGVIRWSANWRQYTYNPCSGILNKDLLRELAEFCDYKTEERREERGEVAKKKAAKTRRVNRLAQFASS